jgi:hypothetical protein
VTDNPLLLRALQVCERKKILFYELLSRLRAIASEFGEEAAWMELALQAAIADEEAAYQQEQAQGIKK